MSTSLDVPFVRANTWNCKQLREPHQLQRCYENRGELDADVAYFGINYDSQKYGVPLHAPYDPPSYATCENGPIKSGVNGDFCVTNVISRKYPPVCISGLVPRKIGGKDNSINAQWQCLPT